MCIGILNDCDGYEILPGNPTSVYKQKLKALVDEALYCTLINKNKHKFLLPEHPVVATFYCLYIASGVASLTQNVGVYLDKVLREYVVSLFPISEISQISF